jgi:sialate O-acetylesterase
MTKRIGGVTVFSFVALLVVQSTTHCQSPSFRLASLIMDNMVLQRETTVPLWGWGVPGRTVSVRASWGDSAVTLVERDSSWMVKLRTHRAGGPYTIAVRHDDASLTLSNVLLGEVWLCSGQSNMEMPLMGWPPRDTIQNAAAEISSAAYADLRLCTVRRAYSAVPEPVCDASWVECSPATVPGFSATAFFFGKKLHETLGVPVGLIHSSWGGTPVEAWINAGSLARLPDFSTTLQYLPECADGHRRIVEWLRQYRAIDIQGRSIESRWRDLDCEDSACPARSYNDSAWRVMRLPTLWEKTEIGNFDGIVWFRKNVTIPAGWVGKSLVLELGPIDDMDVTYVNGVRVGGYEEGGFWSTKRVYQVPGALVDSMVMQIAVRVIDNQVGGGIYGDPLAMVLRTEQSGETLSLAGDWRYAPVAELSGSMLHVFGPLGNVFETRPRMPMDFSANTPTVLYNGMVSPLVPFGIRGSIWYQGEANTERPGEYYTTFPLLIENWRTAFQVGDFPFYYVQIAPYDYGTVTQSQYLREAQTAALAVRNTGMAVTLDIGNAKNIHPTNKQDVGQRLALWALAKTYGKHVAYSGPLYKSMKARTRSLELHFEHAEKGLVLKAVTEGNSFQIAGADRVFKDAVVKVRGKTLLVSHPEIRNPVAVRYAFSNTPQATLFNGAGLPAPSFRTDSWE